MTYGYAIGIDVGGTKVAAGLVDSEGHVVRALRRETAPDDPQAALDTVIEVAVELASEPDVVGIGVGTAGVVDGTGSIVRFAANIGWRDVPLGAQVARATGLPTTIENDGNAAVWGEFRFGRASRARDLVLISVGTGIGGGIVVDGRLYRGRTGAAAEFGHLCVVPDGRLCRCGRRGCWEQYAAGPALVREARERGREHSESPLDVLAMPEGRPGGLDGPLVAAAAASGDPVAVACVAEVGRWLGHGAALLVAVLDPAVVLVSGGVSAAGELLMAPARTAFEAAVVAAERPLVPELRLATLGTNAGIVGAAELGRSVITSSR